MRKTLFSLTTLAALAVLMLACSKQTDEELMLKASGLAESGEFQKAVTNYDILQRIHSDSPLRKEALFRGGLISAVRLNDTEQASSFFELLREDYPRTPVAEGAHSLDAFLNSEEGGDEAEVLYRVGLAYTNLLQDFDTGISLLDELSEKYPENRRTPDALFMKGFILANSVRDTARAGKTYRHFLNKYPESQLASSVEWELHNLGRDINEITTLKEIKK